MSNRSVLGPADVHDDELTRMVADLLGHHPGEVRLLESTAEEFPYDLPAITTAGRYWVSGTACTPRGDERFRIFVKHVQSWSRSPLFAQVPEAFRDAAEAQVPWRTEPLVYRSDLRDRLPAGLHMPRPLGVVDLDEKSAAVWLEEVTAERPEWDLDGYTRAAHLLGRLAASADVASVGDVWERDWRVRDYLDGRLGLQVLPLLRSDEVWQHPLVGGAFGTELRGRLLEAAGRAEAIVEELGAMPLLISHGDACPNNLLAGPEADSLMLIDFGFWNPAPVGFDLGQLLVGDVQIGRRSPDLLAPTESAIVPAYVEGLRAEGNQVPEDVVRRAHALHLLVFTGYSALPFEHLDSPITPGLQQVARDRAAVATFSLDLVDATE
ncbi:MAG: hypothetical protein JWO11_2464 [Nocardioides sp.]|nr:hypothetical protein [Nocardioides sp.]